MDLDDLAMLVDLQQKLDGPLIIHDSAPQNLDHT